jgi:hypothetical protein
LDGSALAIDESCPPERIEQALSGARSVGAYVAAFNRPESASAANDSKTVRHARGDFSTIWAASAGLEWTSLVSMRMRSTIRSMGFSTTSTRTETAPFLAARRSS